MNVTLIIAGRDFSSRLSTYTVTKETAFQTLVTTMGGVEHPAGVMSRDIITFSLWPMSGTTAAADYAVLRPRLVSVTFSNPHTGETSTKQMRVDTDLEAVFGLLSVDGNN